MENFEYRVSVIVPIYNGSEYLKKCLDSLLRQTIGNNQMEVLLINDGSTDESERICQEYTRFYKNFKYFYKENEGLSATRNYGLRRANGKYIAYLDCDDMYSKETLKNVCDFFDMHYEEIDEITIPIVRYKNGKTLPMHYRYKYETKTGIYDLDEFPFVSQTTINIIVKNLLEDNIFFDETPNFRHEDQAYNNEILMKKRKIGFVEEAEYKYNRDNDTGIVNTFMYPYYIFETTMAYYERLFSEYNEVPRYIQALFVHDLVWKLKDDKLLPFHYETNDFNNAMARIRNLLSKVDVDIITSHPSMNNFHAQYWLGLKNNAYPLVVATDKSTARCRAEQIVVSSQFEVENYKKNYHYKDSDLITTGMARYDHINRETSAKRQILYAPSWRKYLTYSPKASNWQLQTDKLVKSDYFNGILAFLNNEKLSDYLEKNDLELHVKLHPIIAEQGSELVSVSCDRIKILNCDVKVKVEEYCAFITDFSSYVFDYACLNRPIMYYVTDYEQFKSGMNHYKELDLPFDKAFGPLFVKDDDVIKYLNCISERKFEPEDLYYQRMKDFFLPLDNCAEKLYQYII